MCVYVCEFVLESGYIFSIRHDHTLGREKFHLPCTIFSFHLFFPWNQSPRTLQSQIIHRSSSFVLVLTGHKAATQKSSPHWLAHSAAPSYTHPYRGRKRSRGLSRTSQKARGQKDKEAPCRVLQLHRCELSFGNEVGEKVLGVFILVKNCNEFFPQLWESLGHSTNGVRLG